MTNPANEAGFVFHLKGYGWGQNNRTTYEERLLLISGQPSSGAVADKKHLHRRIAHLSWCATWDEKQGDKEKQSAMACHTTIYLSAHFKGHPPSSFTSSARRRSSTFSRVFSFRAFLLMKSARRAEPRTFVVVLVRADNRRK